MNTLIYLKNFIMDPYVASVTPTSKFAVGKVCDKIDFSSSRVIVEYGPGTGVFTSSLLEEMPEKARLIAIERNKSFCRVLKKKIRDPRLTVRQEDAQNVLEILKSCNESQVDYVISGIPFSFLSLETKKTILENTYSALKPGGKFLAYQNFFQFPDILKTHLARIFDHLQTQYVIRCFPPLLVFEAVKANGFHPPSSSAGAETPVRPFKT